MHTRMFTCCERSDSMVVAIRSSVTRMATGQERSEDDNRSRDTQYEASGTAPQQIDIVAQG